MPQIWMTYEELAALLDCSAEEARKQSYFENLDRKISRDGKKRVKLSLTMIGIFIERLKTIDFVTDQAVSDLRQMHALMSERDRKAEISPPRRLWSRIAG
jgi:hypothetical protein